MKSYGLKLIMLSAAILSLTGCWKEKFDDCPETGGVTLVTQWNLRDSRAATMPLNYQAIVGTYSGTLSGERNKLEHEFAEGDHHVNVYTTPEQITISGMTATVATDGDGVHNLPGYLFTHTGDVFGLTKGEHREVIAPMTQQVGTVTYEMVMEDGSRIDDLIAGITSVKLEGIASAIHLDDQTLSGASSVSPEFAFDDVGGRYYGESRLLGTMGTSQKLTIDYTLQGGAGTSTLTKDLYSVLEGFNADKAGAYHVMVIVLANGTMPGKLILEPDWTARGVGVAVPADYTAVISDYKGILSGPSNAIAHDFAPGDHHVNVYSTPVGMEISGTMAEVEADSEGIAALPGYLFTYTGDVTGLAKNETRTVPVPMIQQTGTVNYILKMADGSNIASYITAVSAKLESVASRIDIETGALSRPSSISPAFNFTTDRYTATSRIVGTIGASQMLTLEVTLANGNTQVLGRDAATVLSAFNAAKTGDYTILIEINDIDSLTGQITGWTLGKGLTGIID